MIKDLIKNSDITVKEKKAGENQIINLIVKCDRLQNNLSFLKLQIKQAVKNRRKAMADYVTNKIIKKELNKMSTGPENAKSAENEEQNLKDQ